jgi:hypothetical protein
VNGEIGTLEKSISELTDAVKQLTAVINAAKSTASPHISPLNNFHLSEGPKSVCRDSNCGVINSDTILCDHTIARYRSEYDCG